MRVAVRCAVIGLFIVVAVGCAQGGDGRGDGLDASRPDADMDAASDDAGLDAGPTDAGPVDAGPVDAGTDAGPTDAGPLACTPANADAVCGGGPCVDGYCCDAACDGACEGCAVTGSEGTCTPHGAGTDPDDDCAEQAMDSCGTTGSCDGAGACAVYDTDVSCDDGLACTADDACDGAGSCRGDAPPDCAPAAGNECCVGSCDDAGGCVTEASSCADICGGSSLTVSRDCNGCGAPRAAGSCLGGSVFLCDETNRSPCQEVSCGGVSYYCTNEGGTWAWRPNAACDDGDPCTFDDACGGGSCGGSSITCLSSTCMTRACNGTSSCTETVNSGPCDDGDACTFGDACNASGVCASAGTVTCNDSTCLLRSCNGTSSCSETPRTGNACDDGNACTTGEACTAGGICGGGSTVTCPADTPCRTYACDGTPDCAATPRNVGGTCDDGDSGTPVDRCQADGTCLGLTCTPSLNPVFAEFFATPSSSSWTAGTDVQINTSRWNAFTNEGHGVRINAGRMDITNERGSSRDHGHGFAYVRAGGAGAHYNTSLFDGTLANNAGQEIVWSFNMRRDNDYNSEGGFSCSSSSSQNGRMIGLAYVLGATSATGLVSSPHTCSPTGTANGYAVVFGGDDDRVRLVRFSSGLRNGSLTTIARSSTDYSRSSFFSIRVTHNVETGVWQLEVRRDGSSAFSNPAAGSYGSVTAGIDTTYTGVPLNFTGPYFQTGCTGSCGDQLDAIFDNISVGVRCAP